MLRSILAIFRYGLGAAGLHRRVSAVEAMINRRQATAGSTIAELEQKLGHLERMRRGFDAEYDHARELLNQASNEMRALSRSLEAAREEREIDREILIPGLTAANITFVKRWEAETAAMSARAAIQSIPTGNNE